MKFTIETLNDNGSGMVYNTKEDFLKEVSLMIDDCITNSGTFFDIQVDSDVSCFYTNKTLLDKEKFKLGVFVYPIGEDFPNGKKQIKLFTKGIFFTDPEKGWEYEEKMNKTDTEHSCWCASLIRYDTDKLHKKPKEVVDRFVLTIESTTETDI